MIFCGFQLCFHGFFMVPGWFFIFHIEYTLKLYPSPMIQSRPYRPQAGFGLVFTKGIVLLGTFHDKSLGSIGRHSRPVNLVIWKCYLASKSSCHACSYMHSLLEEQMGLATNQKEVGDRSGSTTPTLERLTCWETCRFIGQERLKEFSLHRQKSFI